MVAAARLALLLLGCAGLLWPAGARYIDYCPKGWSYYKFNCFRYFSQPQTWDEAELVHLGIPNPLLLLLHWGRSPPEDCGFTVWSSADCAQQHHYICKFTPSH
ncbi:PREDICTED: regenerating islet-derived protein 4 [Charadrius vociferus]|uniref:regenerating islet-derived protein 4 n=1 Tax=Charadrius vociferus TaxID=50402 RepID=UPI0005217265|nr:PREDICTED: regenerating islet-derived protein 4 [Charadrius vociferus]